MITRVRKSPGVGQRPLDLMRRSKTSPIRSGRPASRLSRMTCSKNTRPLTGRSSIWSENTVGDGQGLDPAQRSGAGLGCSRAAG